MRSACSSMMRKNCSISAGARAAAASSTVAVEPLMAVRGDRSSWLTMPSSSVCSRSAFSMGPRSCRVTTTDSTSPPSPRMGAALTRVRTSRPSGTASTITSSRNATTPAGSDGGSRARASSRPSANRHVMAWSTRSGAWPGRPRASTMRAASRLNDTGRPVRASKTTMPTGEVSTRVSSSARVRAMRCRSAWFSRRSSSSLRKGPPRRPGAARFYRAVRLPPCQRERTPGCFF